MTITKHHHDDRVHSVAVYSDCRRYRYRLTRRWDTHFDRVSLVAFIGLNPSTATEVDNDPTVARCIQYAKDWGFGAMTMLNAFAFRATDPRNMKCVDDPVGPDNDMHLIDVAAAADRVVACWGTHATHLNREDHLLKMFYKHAVRLSCLKLTKEGHPNHPLYLRKDLHPIPFRPEAAS